MERKKLNNKKSRNQEAKEERKIETNKKERNDDRYKEKRKKEDETLKWKKKDLKKGLLGGKRPTSCKCAGNWHVCLLTSKEKETKNRKQTPPPQNKLKERTPPPTKKMVQVVKKAFSVFSIFPLKTQQT